MNYILRYKLKGSKYFVSLLSRLSMVPGDNNGFLSVYNYTT